MIPYRYKLKGDKLWVACRSVGEDSVRVKGYFPAEEKTYVDIPQSYGSNEVIINMLKRLLHTDRVNFDHRSERYVVRGNFTTSHNFRSVIKCPLSTHSLLQDLGKKFFDYVEIDSQGKATFSERKRDVTSFTVCCWLPTYSETGEIMSIAYQRLCKDELPLGLSLVEVSGHQVFNSREEMFSHFIEIIKESDVNVTYDEVKIPHFYEMLDDILNETVILNNLVGKFYPHLSSSTFDKVIKELVGRDVNLCEALGENSTPHHRSQRMECISSESFNSLLSFIDLYMKLSPDILNISLMSGHNMSDILSDTVFRGVVGYYSPLLSLSLQVNKRLHPCSVESCVRKGVYLYGMGQMYHYSLITSSDEATRNIAASLISLKNYWWLMKDIYLLELLEPSLLPDFGSVIGIYEGVMYSTQKIHEDFEPLTKYDLFVSLHTGSFISVSMEKDPFDERSPLVRKFNYVGISPLCSHTFSAIKYCVELHLSCLMMDSRMECSVAVQIISLTAENTSMTVKVTPGNVNSHSHFLTQQNRVEFERDGEVDINLWYKRDGSLTTDKTLLSESYYKVILEEVMKRLISLQHF
jgi:hypothetical protein